MQRSDITLSSTCEVYSSLKGYIKSKRSTFYLVSRNRKKKHPAEESCRENIRRIFVEIIDNLVESLENKIIASLLK